MSLFCIYLNALLPIVNLMPVPPLDGARVLPAVLSPGLGRKFAAVEPYGLIIVMGLLAPGVPGQVVAPRVRAASALLFFIARS